MQIDVFNGDADGLCALQQLRLAEPVAGGQLVTGVKRDIDLLRRVEARPGVEVTVLDISLDRNRTDLERLLQSGAKVRYFDHHYPGEQPIEHPGLELHIDTSAETCTSLLVDSYLSGRYRRWAVVGAFGDNLHASATAAAAGLGLSQGELDLMCELGTLLNYNGYGVIDSDLHYHPAALFQMIIQYEDPLELIARSPLFERLQQAYRADMEQAEGARLLYEGVGCALYELPDKPWSRRVSGAFGNHLATLNPHRAHALATPLEGGYRISIRAPLNNRSGADELARKFATGGGRKGAAGINLLPESSLDQFIHELRLAWPLAVESPG